MACWIRIRTTDPDPDPGVKLIESKISHLAPIHSQHFLPFSRSNKKYKISDSVKKKGWIRIQRRWTIIAL